MTPFYLLTDQHGNFLAKDGQWLPEDSAKRQPMALFRTELKDEAVNRKVEYIVKNPELRIHLVPVTADAAGKFAIGEPEGSPSV